MLGAVGNAVGGVVNGVGTGIGHIVGGVGKGVGSIVGGVVGGVGSIVGGVGHGVVDGLGIQHGGHGSRRSCKNIRKRQGKEWQIGRLGTECRRHECLRNRSDMIFFVAIPYSLMSLFRKVISYLNFYLLLKF